MATRGSDRSFAKQAGVVSGEYDVFNDLFQSPNQDERGGGYFDLIAPVEGGAAFQDKEETTPAVKAGQVVRSLKNLAPAARGTSLKRMDDLSNTAIDDLLWVDGLKALTNGGVPVADSPVFTYQKLADANGQSINFVQQSMSLWDSPEVSAGKPLLSFVIIGIGVIPLGDGQAGDPSQFGGAKDTVGYIYKNDVTQNGSDYQTVLTQSFFIENQGLVGNSPQTNTYDPFALSAPTNDQSKFNYEVAFGFNSVPYIALQKMLIITRQLSDAEILDVFNRMFRQDTKAEAAQWA